MSSEQPPSGAVCIPNINARERRKRLTSGIVALALALAILLFLIISGAAVWWRLLLLPFYWGAASGYFQWREKT